MRRINLRNQEKRERRNVLRFEEKKKRRNVGYS